jgi:hypothetical protein
MADQASPVGVFTLCGSLTTWSGLNPSYCVYEVDKETLLPLTRTTWAYDVEQANLSFPEWVQVTSWLNDYNMVDLSPAAYLSLARKIKDEPGTATSFQEHSHRQNKGEDCTTDKCVKDLFCDLTNFDTYSLAGCKGLPIFNWSSNFLGALRRSMQEPWLEVI